MIAVLSAAACFGAGPAYGDTPGAGGRPGRPAGDGLAGKLLITGSSTMAPMVAEIARRFQSLHPGVQIEVQMGGSGRGISDARLGKADIGMASRALTDEESALYNVAMARDGVCLIVHKDNPVRSLTDRQVADIYTGKITNWSKVGGRDAPIVVMAARGEAGSNELFTHFFKLKYSDMKAQRVLGDNLTRVKALLENPNGIAYISVGEAERQALAGVPIKLVPVAGVAATSRNIRSGDFPLSRPLTLVTRELPKGLPKAFIDFALSPEVTDIIRKYDFVPYLD